MRPGSGFLRWLCATLILLLIHALRASSLSEASAVTDDSAAVRIQSLYGIQPFETNWQKCMNCLTDISAYSSPALGKLAWQTCTNPGKECHVLSRSDDHSTWYWFFWKEVNGLKQLCDGTEATQTATGYGCYHNQGSPCNDCCGGNAAMSYSLPKCTTGSCPYGETSSFSEHCGQIEARYGNSCDKYTCSLYNDANVALHCPKMNDGTDGSKEKGFNGCIHLPLVAKGTPATLKRGNYRRFELLPGTPSDKWGNPGVEWYENYEDYGEHLLNLAWSAAYNPYWLIYSGYKKLTKRTYVDLPVQDNAAHIGIAFNPATIRSMHQLHIHIGAIPRPIRALFTEPAQFTNWRKVHLPRGGILNTDNHYAMAYARYFKVNYDHHSWNGPGDNRVFQQILNFAGGSHERMKAFGVLILPDHTDIWENRDDPGYFKFYQQPRGYYLIVAINQKHGSATPLYGPLNPFWVPEWFVCTYDSTHGTGSFSGWWTHGDGTCNGGQCECPFVG